ncbi:MAG: SAM-dependent methyltransferase, partial [Bryobacterales bacterium]|nr:SAM-dependent methyltransferase [Bryobacterales bacterium]
MNETKLNEFMGKLVNDMGGAALMASVLVGEDLGLYRAMADG